MEKVIHVLLFQCGVKRVGEDEVSKICKGTQHVCSQFFLFRVVVFLFSSINALLSFYFFEKMTSTCS